MVRLVETYQPKLPVTSLSDTVRPVQQARCRRYLGKALTETGEAVDLYEENTSVYVNIYDFTQAVVVPSINTLNPASIDKYGMVKLLIGETIEDPELLKAQGATKSFQVDSADFTPIVRSGGYTHLHWYNTEHSVLSKQVEKIRERLGIEPNDMIIQHPRIDSETLARISAHLKNLPADTQYAFLRSLERDSMPVVFHLNTMCSIVLPQDNTEQISDLPKYLIWTDEHYSVSPLATPQPRKDVLSYRFQALSFNTGINTIQYGFGFHKRKVDFKTANKDMRRLLKKTQQGIDIDTEMRQIIDTFVYVL